MCDRWGTVLLNDELGVAESNGVIYIFISPIMVAINIFKKSRTQTHAHEHTRYTHIRNYMPTVHVVKQYMIDL